MESVAGKSGTHRESTSTDLGHPCSTVVFIFSVGILLKTLANLSFLQTTAICWKHNTLPSAFLCQPVVCHYIFVYRTQKFPYNKFLFGVSDRGVR